MAVFDGCEGNAKTWVLEEMDCPRRKGSGILYFQRTDRRGRNL